jgi:hypothetical protein
VTGSKSLCVLLAAVKVKRKKERKSIFHTLKSDGMSTTLLYFEFFIPCSSESVSEKKRKSTSKTIAGKLEVIREVDKNENEN